MGLVAENGFRRVFYFKQVVKIGKINYIHKHVCIGLHCNPNPL